MDPVKQMIAHHLHVSLIVKVRISSRLQMISVDYSLCSSLINKMISRVLVVVVSTRGDTAPPSDHDPNKHGELTSTNHCKLCRQVHHIIINIKNIFSIYKGKIRQVAS